MGTKNPVPTETYQSNVTRKGVTEPELAVGWLARKPKGRYKWDPWARGISR